MPSPEREKLRRVALMWGGSLGPAGFRRLVQRFGGTREVLEAGAGELRDPALRLSPEQAGAIAALAAQLENYATRVVELERLAIRVLCPGEDGYPLLWAELDDAPPVVCMSGRLLPEDDPAVAIVGTRTPTREGAALGRALGAAMAQQGTTVVSGLARGCDTEAHLGALDAGGRTVAVLGSGILAVHPRANLDLAREISGHGAVLSECEPSAPPTVGRLMARNRLTSGLARGVIVVQAREQGGALETARRGRAQGRLVWVASWPAGLAEGSGAAALRGEGALELGGVQGAEAVRLALVDHLARLRQVPAKVTEQLRLFGE